MKKIILLIAILFAGFTGLWHYNAARAKQFVASKFDEATAYFDKEGYILKNEGIDVTGYPLDYQAVIKSPSLIKKEQAKEKSDPVDSILVDGKLSLISNLFGTEFSVENNGKTRIIVKNGDSTDEFILIGDSSSSFSVEGVPFIEAIKNPFKAYFHEIESNDKQFLIGKNGSFSGKNLKLFNVKNPSVTLLEMDKADIEYALKDTDGELSFIKFKGDVKGLNIDTLIVGSDAYNPGNTRSLKEISMMLSMPKPGKTDISFDMELDAPFNQFEDLGKIASLNDLAPFNLDLKNFDMKNDFGSYFHKGLFSFKDVKEAKQFQLNLLGTQETSKEQFAAFRVQWEEFLNNLPICTKNVEENSTDVCPLVKGLVPQLDTFGKIVFDIDALFDVRNPVDLSDNSTLTINRLNFYSALYGMKSNSLFNFKQPEMVVSTSKIELLNYQAFFQDLFNYLKKAEKILPHLMKEGESFPNIQEKHVKLITDYLKAISDEPNKDLKDLTITIKVDGLNEIKIGTLPSNDFIQKTMIFNSELMKDFTKQKVENPKPVIKQ